jgi:hypothetical protein
VATGYGDRPIPRAAPRGESRERGIPADAEPPVRRCGRRTANSLADLEVPEFIPR